MKKGFVHGIRATLPVSASVAAYGSVLGVMATHSTTTPLTVPQELKTGEKTSGTRMLPSHLPLYTKTITPQAAPMLTTAMGSTLKR